MAVRTIVSAVVAARRDDMDNLINELFSWGLGAYSIPMRPANSQGPMTHYGFNAAGLSPAVADALSALNDGTMPEFIWADGAPTQTPPAWGQGNLPTEQQAQAIVAGQNVIMGNMSGGGNPGQHWVGFVGGLTLEVVPEEPPE